VSSNIEKLNTHMAFTTLAKFDQIFIGIHRIWTTKGLNVVSLWWLKQSKRNRPKTGDFTCRAISEKSKNGVLHCHRDGRSGV